MSGGVANRLREVTRDGRSWVELGQVTAIEAHDAWGYLLTVALRPDGREVQCRPVYAGAGDAIGDFWPGAVDDEVLVIMPGGDPNRSVVLCGLTSTPATPPSDWDNDQPQLCHPNGKHFRTTEGATLEAVLLGETFQSDAGTWETALKTFMTSVSSATTVAAIAAAAATFLSAAGSFDTNLSGGNYSAKAVKSE